MRGIVVVFLVLLLLLLLLLLVGQLMHNPTEAFLTRLDQETLWVRNDNAQHQEYVQHQ